VVTDLLTAVAADVAVEALADGDDKGASESTGRPRSKRYRTRATVIFGVVSGRMRAECSKRWSRSPTTWAQRVARRVLGVPVSWC